MVERSDYAACYKYAPTALTARWVQTASRRTVEWWESERADEYRQLRNQSSVDLGMVIDVSNPASSEGRYGNPGEFRLTWELDIEFLDLAPETETALTQDSDGESLWAFDADLLVDRDDIPDVDRETVTTVVRFGRDFVETLIEVMNDDHPDALTEIDYLTYVACHGGRIQEVADAFGVFESRVRDRLSRAQDHVRAAREVLGFDDDLTYFCGLERRTFHGPAEAVTDIPEDHLPIDSTDTSVQNLSAYRSYAPDNDGEVFELSDDRSIFE